VGQALRENGITLQNLDYSVPGDESPLPADGKIKVVRVREEIVVNQQALPFDTEYVSDNTLELGQTKIITEGSTVWRSSVFSFGTKTAKRYQEWWKAARPCRRQSIEKKLMVPT
jgi:hypothetical protein